jgi:hypothetical protein
MLLSTKSTRSETVDDTIPQVEQEELSAWRHGFYDTEANAVVLEHGPNLFRNWPIG